MKNELLIKKSIFLGLCFSFSLIYFNLQGFGNFKIFLTNFIILVFSSFFMVFGDKYNYSINKFFYLYSYFFLGIAPILQYTHNINFWTDENILEIYYLRTNIILIISLIFYQILYFKFNKNESNKLENFLYKYFSLENKIIRKELLIILPIFVLIITLYRLDFNIITLFFKTKLRISLLAQRSQIENLIYNNFISVIPLLCLIVFKISKIKNKALEIYLILILLLTNFPTVLSRYAVARIYIPIVIIYFNFMKKYFVLNFTTIFGLLYLFPLLNKFRYFKNLKELKFNIDFSMFVEAHFDSYQNFLRVLKEELVTNGRQLIGVFLFWVPRGLWKNKPIGSGAFLAEKSGFKFSNISLCYFGEGYINFGYLGIFLFIIFIAYINARFDKFYWTIKEKNYFLVFYLIMLSMELFVLRGDLLSSFAYLVGSYFSCIFIYWCVFKTVRE